MHHDQAAHNEYAHRQDDYDEQEYGDYPEHGADLPPPADLYMIGGIAKDQCEAMEGVPQQTLLPALPSRHGRKSYFLCGNEGYGSGAESYTLRHDSVKLTDLLDLDDGMQSYIKSNVLYSEVVDQVFQCGVCPNPNCQDGQL